MADQTNGGPGPGRPQRRERGRWAAGAQRSALERRSVVSGSCWMVWCSIRASKPARLVMAVRTLRSCSNSSSSLYHCAGSRSLKQQPWSPAPLDPGRVHTPAVRARRAVRTYHAHALQVHLGTPQLLPAVVPVALALGQTAEVTRELENIPYEGAPAYLVSWHLRGARGGWGKWQVRRSGKEREERWGQKQGRNARKGCIRKAGANMGGGRERGWESLTLGSRECSGHSTWSRLQYVLL